MSKVALVLGGAGFIGGHLSERLLQTGREVVVVDNLYTGTEANVPACARFINADVRELSAADFPHIDEVYNFACPASPVHYQAMPIDTTLTSIKGALLALEIVRRDNARLLHASTSEIYGDPVKHPQNEHDWGNVNTIGWRSCYDEGKRVAETLIADYRRMYDVDARIIRIFNTYGPGMLANDGRVISNFIVQALKGENITIYGDGSQTRSFQYVDDLIEASLAFMSIDKARLQEFFAQKNLEAWVLNIGNPEEHTILELAQAVLERIVNTTSKLVKKPLPSDDPRKRRPDITLAKALLEWEPKVHLDEGISATIEYFKGALHG